MLLLLPSGPGDSRAEFGPSRERSKKLTRVPTGGTATRSFTPELQWRREGGTDAVERGMSGAQEVPKRTSFERIAEQKAQSQKAWLAHPLCMDCDTQVRTKDAQVIEPKMHRSEPKMPPFHPG